MSAVCAFLQTNKENDSQQPSAESAQHAKLIEKLQFHENHYPKPSLAALYAHSDSQVTIEDGPDHEEIIAASIMPQISHQSVVAAFQRVQAEIECWRGLEAVRGDKDEPNAEIETDEDYEDGTFLTGLEAVAV